MMIPPVKSVLSALVGVVEFRPVTQADGRRRRYDHRALHRNEHGNREGADVPQVYLNAAPNEKRMRLLGFERVELEPGQSVRVTLTADARLRARFDGQKKQCRIDEGEYAVALSRAADAPVDRKEVRLGGRTFGV